MLKNPKECFCLKQKQTFFILNELTTPEGKDGSEPLTFHHETFSRFKFVIINADKKPTTANIPVFEIPEIEKKVEYLDFSRFMSVPEPASLSAEEDEEQCSSAAYSVVLTAGKLKGKTPAGALLESESNLIFLENQVKWLESNIAKYPKNKIQIDAIKEALELFKNKKLKQNNLKNNNITTNNNGEYVVFEAGVRPLIRRKNKKGLSFVYEIKISYNKNIPEKPVTVEIANYFAPVIKTETGLLNVKIREREDYIKNQFSITMTEWRWMMHIIKTQIHTFEELNAAKLYKMAIDEEKNNRFAASKGV